MNDLKFAFRQLLKNPGFTAVAVLTLALGIGSATSVFSLFNAVLLRSLPVPNPGELRVLHWSGVESRVPSLVGRTFGGGSRQIAECFSPETFPQLREGASDVADVFAFASVENFAVGIGNQTVTADGMTVSDNFFSGLGVSALLGRTFNPGLQDTDAARSAVISWNWWQRHFGGDVTALGRTLSLKQQSFTVVGVMPPGFQGVDPARPTDFFVLLAPGSPLLDRPLSEATHWWIQLMARARPGVSDLQLRSVLGGIFARETRALMTDPQMVVEAGRGGLSFERESYRKPLFLMLGIVGLVMLAACANLAGLSLARNASRRHELAIRSALGASLWQRVRQSLVESLLLSFAGGGLGIAAAVWGRAVVARLLIGSAGGLRYDLSLDLTVLAFTFGAVLLTSVLAGALPVLLAGRVDPSAALKERGALRLSRLRSGKILVVAQISVSLLLVSCAGLYIRTLVNLHHVDVGFDAGNLLLFQVRPMDAGYHDEAAGRYYDRVQQTLAALPGVKAASLVQYPLLSDQSSMGGFSTPGIPDGTRNDLETHRLLVGETFFETMGIPFLEGRAWNHGDAAGIVLNESFVKRFFPDRNPIGQTLNFWRVTWHVTGVCRDLKHRSVKEATPPTVYASYLGRLTPATMFAVRTMASPLTMAGEIRRSIGQLDRQVPVVNLSSQNQILDSALGPERLFAKLGGALGALALLLSCLGLYGLMAYNVTRRRSEIAIRMAIGAQRGEVAAAVIREALVLTAIGGAVGLPLVFVATRLLRSQLFGVGPNDPLTGVAVIGALALVSLIAAGVPAWRASRQDPLVALRNE